MAFKGLRVFALAPARAGSKGVPGKNLRRFNGRPLLEHTIDAARSCEFIDDIILSSDSEEILNLGRRLGALSHLRSPLAATDSATATEVVANVIDDVIEGKFPGDCYIVYLQPTSPLRRGAHISAAFNLMAQTGSEGCVSVVHMSESPYKSYILSLEGRLQPIFDEQKTNSNRQCLPVAYYPNGAIYIFLVSEFLKKGQFPTNGAIPLIMSPEESIDIDTEEDLIYAESICRLR